MSLIDKCEQKFSWLSIEHLPIYVVSAQAILYLWNLVNPESQSLFWMDPMAILYGKEYWRLITFLFITPMQNAIFAFFYLYLLYVYGMALEEAWGSFKFTLFYLVGAIGTIIAGLVFGSADGSFFLNSTIFLAFAAVHPDFVLYFFFVIPVKVKWFAILTWMYFAYHFILYPFSFKMAILISLANYFLFLGNDHWQWLVEQKKRFQHRQRFKDWPSS